MTSGNIHVHILIRPVSGSYSIYDLLYIYPWLLGFRIILILKIYISLVSKRIYSKFFNICTYTIYVRNKNHRIIYKFCFINKAVSMFASTLTTLTSVLAKKVSSAKLSGNSSSITIPSQTGWGGSTSLEPELWFSVELDFYR